MASHPHWLTNANFDPPYLNESKTAEPVPEFRLDRILSRHISRIRSSAAFPIGRFNDERGLFFALIGLSPVILTTE
jgi:hypothetical protein